MTKRNLKEQTKVCIGYGDNTCQEEVLTKSNRKIRCAYCQCKVNAANRAAYKKRVRDKEKALCSH